MFKKSREKYLYEPEIRIYSCILFSAPFHFYFIENEL